MNLGKALIVEDDESWQMILEEILQEIGFQVCVAAHASRALEALEANAFRLLVADLSLEDEDHSNQDGLHVLAAVKAKQPGCVSLLLTGYATVELTVQALREYGAYTCLRKETFNRKAFVDLILSALEEPALNGNDSPIQSSSLSQQILDGDDNKPTASASKGRVLLVEDDSGWLSILQEILEEEGYHVRACTSFGQAHGLLLHEKFNLAVMDLNLSPNRLNGAVNGEAIKDAYPEGNRLLQLIQAAQIPVFVVSGEQRIQAIEDIYRTFNIHGYFEKQNFERRVFLHEIATGVDQLAVNENRYQLTDREIQVLMLLVQGKENKEIADQLVISPNTVKRHIKAVFAKMGVHSRAAAVAAYLSSDF